MLAAVLICASLTRSQGQPRYSHNIAGYLDAEFVAGSNLVANPFNAGDNSVSNLFADVPLGSFFLPWDSVRQAFGLTNRFSAETGWSRPADRFTAGQGAFLWLPRATRLSFAGELWPDMPCFTFPPGTTISSVLPTLGCGVLCADVTDCPFPGGPAEGTEVSRWNPQGQGFESAAVFVPGAGWIPNVPSAAPHEAVRVVAPEAMGAKTSFGGSPSGVALTGPAQSGTNFTFQFQSEPLITYRLKRSSDLRSNVWQTVGTVVGMGGPITVTNSAANSAAFYRLHRADHIQLVNPRRTGTNFSFQFETDAGVTYRVSRKSSFAGSAAWSVVLEIAGDGSVMTATDSSATNSSGWYRIEF